MVQIVCGTYPDELGLLKPSWENEGGMPYMKKDFSVVNPEYFKFADRRFEPGSWSAFYFDPVSGRRHDLGVHTLSGTWKSPNVPSPQDWVLVLERVEKQ